MNKLRRAARKGEGRRFLLPFLKIEKKYPNFGKYCPICVHLCFPAEPFFCMSCMKCLSKCPYSQKPVLPQKLPGCTPVTFNLTFRPNFHPNILLVFANLPVYKKLIHDDI